MLYTQQPRGLHMVSTTRVQPAGEGSVRPVLLVCHHGIMPQAAAACRCPLLPAPLLGGGHGACVYGRRCLCLLVCVCNRALPWSRRRFGD